MHFKVSLTEGDTQYICNTVHELAAMLLGFAVASGMPSGEAVAKARELMAALDQPTYKGRPIEFGRFKHTGTITVQYAEG